MSGNIQSLSGTSVNVVNLAGQTLATTLLGSTVPTWANPMLVSLLGSTVPAWANPMAVSNSGQTAAVWQSPTKTAPFSLNITAGTPQTIVSGVNGQIVYVHAIFIVSNAAANVIVKDTSGTIFARGSGAANTIALNTDLKGFALASGVGIQLDTSVNAGLNGLVAYTQQ